MAIYVIDTMKKNYKEHLLEANGVVVARYFSVKDHYKAEAYVEHNLLNIVLEGKKMIHTKNGDIEVNVGEGFFLSRGEYVMSEVCEGGHYSCLLIFFDEKVIAPWLSPLLAMLPLHVKIDPKFSEPLCKITLSALMKSTALSFLPLIEQKPLLMDKLLILKLQELLILLLGAPQGHRVRSYFEILLPRSLDFQTFMMEHFTKNWTLKEFAKRSGRSLSAFKAECALQFQTTPMKWILDRRVERAHFLIEKGGLSSSEASFNVGFKSASHFSRLFKARYTYTPKNLIDKRSNVRG